jgi:hypothetical protein
MDHQDADPNEVSMDERYRTGDVDLNAPHFELMFEDGNDDPSTWRVVAQLQSDEHGRPVVAFRTDDASERRTAHNEIMEALDPNTERTSITYVGPNRTSIFAWAESLTQWCGSTSNAYGPWHWRRRRARPQ